MNLATAIFNLIFLGVILSGSAQTENELKVEVVSFPSGKTTFRGYLFKPEGKGPFGVVVWNHGHADNLTKGSLAEFQELAKLYTRDGFALFLPNRHLRDVTPSEFSSNLQKDIKAKPSDEVVTQRQYFELLDVNANDISAAIDWLAEQSFIDAHRIALSGWASGATTSLVVASKNPRVRVSAIFSPGVTRTRNTDNLTVALKNAAQKCSSPVFLVLGKDDPQMESIEILKGELEKKGKINRVQIYPHTGFKGTEHSALAVNGCDTWGYDVLRFIQTAMKE